DQIFQAADRHPCHPADEVREELGIGHAAEQRLQDRPAGSVSWRGGLFGITAFGLARTAAGAGGVAQTEKREGGGGGTPHDRGPLRLEALYLEIVQVQLHFLLILLHLFLLDHVDDSGSPRPVSGVRGAPRRSWCLQAQVRDLLQSEPEPVRDGTTPPYQ